MRANQDLYPVSAMCRLLDVSAAGFYHWQDRPLSARARRDVEVLALIHEVYGRSDSTYGAPPCTGSYASRTGYVWDASGWLA